MKINYDFIPQGSVVGIDGNYLTYENDGVVKKWAKNSSVVCDTGGSVGDGVIDHHFPGSENLCCSALIYHDIKGKNKLFSHLDLKNEEFTIVTHIDPDFDALASCYLIELYLRNGNLPSCADEFVQYVNEVDSGKLVIDPAQPVNPATMVLAISSEVFNSDSDLRTKNLKVILETYKLFDKIFELLKNNNTNIWSSEFIVRDLGELDRFEDKIVNDKEVYLKKDILNSSFYTIDMINIKENTFEKVDLIATDSPESELWKYWARSDVTNSPSKHGFLFTCVFLNTFKTYGRQRAIIATEPNSPYNLKGLGILLEKYEMEELATQGLLEHELTKEKRKGFHRNDPWYDGRAELHNFTIIDSPNHGSVLTNELILEIILRYELWSDLGQHLEKFNSIDSIRSIISNDYADYNQNQYKLLHDLVNLSANDLSHVLTEINRFSYLLKCSSEKNIIDRDKKKLTRDIIYDAFINLNNKTKDETWNNRITQIIVANFSISYLKNWIKESMELNEDALLISIKKLFQFTNKREIIPLLLILQTNHTNSFTNLVNSGRFSRIIDSLISFKSSEADKRFYKSIIELANKINLTYPDNYIKENFPLSSFITYSNIIDELSAYFTLKNSDSPAGKLIENVNNFIETISSNSFRNSFDAIVKDYSDLRKSIKNELFGVENVLIKKLRDDFLKNNYNLISEMKTLLMQNFDDIELRSFLTLVDRLEQLSKLTDSEKELVGRLKAFLIIRIYDDLFSRCRILINLSEINRIAELHLFNPELYILTELLQNLIKNILTNHHTSEDEVKKNLLESLEKINQLKNINYSSFNLNIDDILEDLYEFIKTVHLEINEEGLKIEEEIENSYIQFNKVFFENGLLRKIDKIPIFFKHILEEIFLFYKNYYKQKIELLEKTKLAIECNDEKLKEITDELLDKVIYFDLTNEKNKNFNNQQRENFYLSLLHRERYRVSNKVLYHSSNILLRRAINKKRIKDEVIALPIPLDKTKIISQEIFDIYISSILIPDSSPHLTKQHYLKAYNFIIEKRLESYDFENAKYSLEKISPGFPRWLKTLSNLKAIKFITLVIISLVLLTAAFDDKIYTFNEISFRPQIPNYVFNLIPNHFNLISKYLQFSWVFLIYGTIITAFAVITFKVFNSFRSKFKQARYETSVQRISNLTEYKKLNLLLLHFLFPLLIVIAQIVHPETLKAFFNIGGSRLLYLGVLSIILVIHSIRKDIQDKNPSKNIKWINQKASYVFWLYLFQTLVVSVLVLDLFVKFEISEEMFSSYKQLTDMGFSKILEFHFYYLDVVIFPIFTFTLTASSLLFSVFIEKLFSKKT